MWLVVLVNGATVEDLPFTSLSAAKTFFTDDSLPLGAVQGSPVVEIELFVDYTSTTSITTPAGFSFTYDLATTPVPATSAAAAFDFAAPSPSPAMVPEPSTWTMMLVGFAGLVFAGYRARSAHKPNPHDLTECKAITSDLHISL
jgi:PEP-CTERM motif